MVLIVIVRFFRAVGKALSADLIAEETLVATRDALPGWEASEGNGVVGAHVHAAPGWIVGECTLSAVVCAWCGEVIGECSLAALLCAKTCLGVGPCVLFSTCVHYVEETFFKTQPCVVVAKSCSWAVFYASVRGVVTVQRREEGALSDAGFCAIVFVCDDVLTSDRICKVGAIEDTGPRNVVGETVCADVAFFLAETCWRVCEEGGRTVLCAYTGCIEPIPAYIAESDTTSRRVLGI